MVHTLCNVYTTKAPKAWWKVKTKIIMQFQVHYKNVRESSMNVLYMVSFHYGADHYDACQCGDSTMAQVQLGAFRYGVFQYGADLVWRRFGMAHSSMAQVQYGAFQYDAVPVWRFEASSQTCRAAYNLSPPNNNIFQLHQLKN